MLNKKNLLFFIKIIALWIFKFIFLLKEEKIIMDPNNIWVNTYIRHHRFRKKTESLFVRTKPSHIISDYTERYKLYDEVEKEIINRHYFLTGYVTRHQLSTEALKEFLTKYFNYQVLGALFENKLSNENELILAQYAMESYIIDYYISHGFNNISDVISILLKRGFTNVVMELIRRNKANLGIRVEEEILASDHEVVMTYLENYEISSEQQLSVIERGSSYEIINMIKHTPVSPKTQLKILARGQKKEILTLMETYQCCQDFQMALMARGNTDEIIALCASNTLFNDAQKALIKRGMENEIMVYLNRKTLSDEAFSILLDTSEDLVAHYIYRNVLTEYQLSKFVEKASDDNIKTYLELYFKN